MKTQRQQGDVNYERISKLPEGIRKVEKKERGWVLAEGESTGHAHIIEEECELYEKDGKLYLVNENSVTLKHEEHAPQTIEPGIWEIERVREYDYTKEMTKYVAD